MSKRTRSPEAFDVTEFLRPTDTDMRSALNSLLRGASAPQLSPVPTITPPGGNLPPGDLMPPGGTDCGQRAEGKHATSPPGGNLPPGGHIEPATPIKADGLLPPGGKLPPGRILRCVRVQDGHTAAEELLYQALWREAKLETKETRVITVGYRGMAALTRQDPKTVKYVCQSLISKFALEQIGSESTLESIGRTYRVYSYKTILERRAAAGLNWILRRRGGGVVFVEPPEGKLPPGGHKPPGAGGDLPPGPGGNLPPGGPIKGAPPGGNLPPHRDNVVKTQQQTPSAIALEVRQTLQKYVTTTDDVAVDLVTDCLCRVPDATPDEIIHFLILKADLMERMTIVRNPIGFLRHSVPKCFEGENFQQYRRLERQRKEAMQQLDFDPAEGSQRKTKGEKENLSTSEAHVRELVKRGVSEKQAQKLLASLPKNQPVLDELEYGDHLIAKSPGTFRNPPGFYISLLKDNVIPPRTFETSRDRYDRKVQQQARRHAQLQEEELKREYEDHYRTPEIERYIQTELSESEYARLMDEFKNAYRREWPRLHDDTLTEMARGRIRGTIEPKVALLSFHVWKSTRDAKHGLNPNEQGDQTTAIVHRPHMDSE